MEQTFELKKLKIGMEGVDCHYNLEETGDDGITHTFVNHVKDSREIHPDLSDLFEQLKPMIAEILGIESMHPELGPGMEFASEETKELCEKVGNMKNRIVPIGVAFAGKNDNIGISIIGELRTKWGSISFKTPRLKYKIGDSKLCAKLTVWSNAIINEMHAYLFEGKTADLETFGE